MANVFPCTPQELEAAVAKRVQPRVVNEFPDDPLVNEVYRLKEDLVITDPVPDAEYPASVNGAPGPKPQGVISLSLGLNAALDSVWHSFLYGQLSDLLAYINTSNMSGPTSLTADSGEDVYAYAIINTGVYSCPLFLYLTDSAMINGVGLPPGWCYRDVDDPVPQQIPGVPAALTGVWAFSEQLIESGLVAIMMDIAIPAGFYFNDGDAWNRIVDADDSNLDGRVGVLEGLADTLEGRVDNLEVFVIAGINGLGPGDGENGDGGGEPVIPAILLRLGELESLVETMDGTGGKAYAAQMTANQALGAAQAAWQELDGLRDRIEALEQKTS